MRILVNYQPTDQNFLPILQYHLKARNFQAIATALPLSHSELLMKARHAQCDAILICNQDTLRQCTNNIKATLDLYRGSLIRFSIPAIVCNSLSHTQTVDHGNWLLGKDLDKFKTLDTRLEEENKFSFTLLETSQQMEEAYEVLASSALIAYDIETKTVGENEETCQAGETIITCVSYTAVSHTNKLTTYVIPFIDFLEPHFHKDQDFINAIQFLRTINSLAVPKVMHNGMYDCLHSITYHAWPNNWTLDTMALAHSEFSELPKSLDFVASITLPDYMQWKTDAEEASRKKDIHQYWAYNGKDTWHTARICLHYIRNLPTYARRNYAMQFPLVYPTLACAFEGLLIDQAKRKELREKALANKELQLEKIQKMAGDKNFNPASPKQVKELIYDIFGAADPHIGQRKDAKTGKRTRMVGGTDEKNLRIVGEQHPLLLRLTDSILSYRGDAKAISTYFDFLQYNGRLLWSLNPFGTDTGRMSCQASSFWCGTQVQNIPSYAKDMLIADEGYTLIEIDNSQSEARCTAYLSKELKLIEALEGEKDFYKSLGTLFFGIPYEEVTKEFRNAILKKIVHGTNYMMGAKTFIESAGVQNLLIGAKHLGKQVTLNKKPLKGEISLNEFATELLEAYHKPFPRVREWYKEVSNNVATTHSLTSPLGYTRYFFGDISKNHNMLRGAVAHAPQNLSVTILNIGLMKVWNLIKLEKSNIRMKAQIHDSIFLQIKDTEINRLLPVVLHSMRNGVEIYGRTLHIPVDYKMGRSWGSMKEYKS